MADETLPVHVAIAALSQFFVGRQTLGESLAQVAELSIAAVPNAAYAGVTLYLEGRLQTSAFTHPDVPEVDEEQYRTARGPCVDAFRTGTVTMIESTLEPGEWQAFRDVAAAHGIRSTLALPLTSHDGPIGALNLYAPVERAFDEPSQRTAAAFATQAAFMLANAQAYWDARTLSENLQQAMASRATIEQAKGIIMASMSCGPEKAMELLVRQSQEQNIKVRDLAAQIVRATSRTR